MDLNQIVNIVFFFNCCRTFLQVLESGGGCVVYIEEVQARENSGVKQQDE